MKDYIYNKIYFEYKLFMTTNNDILNNSNWFIYKRCTNNKYPVIEIDYAGCRKRRRKSNSNLNVIARNYSKSGTYFFV